MTHTPEMTSALAAAAAAARIIRHYYAASRDDLDVQLKADSSPVTIADVEAEKAIREILLSAFPDDGFYGEETGASGSGSRRLWLVDPIDGTKSFVRRYPFVSTQIALMQDGELILGVSSAPLFDQLAYAEVGRGAWRNDERLKVSDVSSVAEATLSSGNIGSLAASGSWAAYGELVTEVNRIRGYGDFYHYHLLAAGSIDAVVESDVNILDIAALTVIVREAGGQFTELDGSAVDLDTRTVLATNGPLHETLRRRLAYRGD